MVGMSSSQAPDNFITAGRPDLCEFSLLGRVFRLASFGKLQKQAILLCHSFPDKTLLLILTKKWIGLQFGRFFHKVIWHSACIKCQCVHATNSITYLVCINHRAANVIMYICTCAHMYMYMCIYMLFVSVTGNHFDAVQNRVLLHDWRFNELTGEPF
jgi:hypothetical protein